MINSTQYLPRILFFICALLVVVLNAQASSSLPPPTNVQAVRAADLIVTGIYTGKKTEEIGEVSTLIDLRRVIIQRVFTKADFLITEVLTDSRLDVGDTIRISIIGGEKEGIKTDFIFQIPSPNQEVLLSLQDQTQELVNAYVETNVSTIIPGTDEERDSLREWVSTIRSADKLTLKALIKAERNSLKNVSFVGEGNKALPLVQHHLQPAIEEHSDTVPTNNRKTTVYRKPLIFGAGFFIVSLIIAALYIKN